MAIEGLIDSGAILAYLDERDMWHASCAEALERIRFPLMTSAAALTEVFHFVLRKRIDLEVTWTFVRSGVIVVGSITDDDLPDLHALMSKYSDQPMDFADATLVHLARRESIHTILTVDRDFETYRVDGRKKFTILPAQRY
jgi:predicted nucleic acid-binding protein